MLTSEHFPMIENALKTLNISYNNQDLWNIAANMLFGYTLDEAIKRNESSKETQEYIRKLIKENKDSKF